MRIKLIEGGRGATVGFGGCVSLIARKDVARVMASAPKPVWSVKPRRGFHVITLESGSWYKYVHIHEPGESLSGAVHAMSVHYLERLQCMSRSPSRSRGW